MHTRVEGNGRDQLEEITIMSVRGESEMNSGKIHRVPNGATD